ncbi:MAG: beta-lactamase family protein [Planctomycetes bacterium]|nr:beta-lactamase family protein [Planctomycetota bacterium]
MLRPLTSFLVFAGLSVAQSRAPTADATALAEATAAVARLVDQGDVLGMVVLVQRGDDVLVHEAFGHRDVEQRQPMQKDTLFRMASNTKAVTAAAVLTLVEQGKVGLDDPIARWFPTFDHDDAAKITVRQLLTHSSGLRIEPLFLQPLMEKSDEHPDAPNLVLECARFGEVGPAVTPGTSYSYNNPGYNLCAGLVEVCTGENFADYVGQRFYEPLGMRDSCHHETVADNDRMSVVVEKGEDGNWRVDWRPGGKPTMPFVRGSGGMISTTTDFARFCRMLLDGGVIETADGPRHLLAADSVAAAWRDQIPQLKERYGFGWAIGEDGFVSHSGSDGTWAMCDPARDVIALVFTQTQESEALEKARRAFGAAVRAACPPVGRK